MTCGPLGCGNLRSLLKRSRGHLRRLLAQSELLEATQSHFEPSWKPLWCLKTAPRCLKTAQRAFQEASRRLQEGSHSSADSKKLEKTEVGATWGLRTAQARSKRPPDGSQRARRALRTRKNSRKLRSGPLGPLEPLEGARGPLEALLRPPGALLGLTWGLLEPP